MLFQQLVSIPEMPYLVGLDRHDIVHVELLLGDRTLAMVLQRRRRLMNLAETIFPDKKLRREIWDGATDLNVALDEPPLEEEPRLLGHHRLVRHLAGDCGEATRDELAHEATDQAS
jgi:hypothetical protein